MAQIILDSNNNLIQGDFDNATLNNRTKLQTTTTNATTNVYVVPNGSSTSAGVSVANNSSLTNASKIVMATNGSTDTQIISGINGSGTYLPMSFYTNNALAMQVDTGGNVIVNDTAQSGSAKLTVKQTVDTTIGGVAIVATDGNGANLSRLTDGGLTFRNGGAERMRITSAGDLLVGATSATVGANNGTVIYGAADAGIIYMFRASGSTDQFRFYVNNTNIGKITTTASATSYVTSSDYRLKENILPMTGALDTVAQLKPVTYKWKADGSDGQGFIAHELQSVVPDCVVGEKDAVETYTDEEGNEQTRIKPQGVDTSFLVATLTAAIQEQQTIINELKTRIEALESK
jgi:hypothetical protein